MIEDKALVKYLLQNAKNLPAGDWTVQGFGFLRLRVGPNTRIHIWDSRLRVPGVSDIHDHAQWAFSSRVISGSIINTRYNLEETENSDAQTPGTLSYNMATILCGVGGGMTSGSTQKVLLRPIKPEMYLPGQVYSQAPDEIHRTAAQDGTVTILSQIRRDTPNARVFWPLGGLWGDAIPRKARTEEIVEVVNFALSIFDQS